jgi:hypothetical protein
MSNYEVTGREPHDPDKTFTVIVRARSKQNAKDHVRWLYALGGQRLIATPTDKDSQTQAFKPKYYRALK